MLEPRSPAQRRRRSSLVEVPLDHVQRAAIALAAGRALLVLGEAGHGKTTVLLHRVARLARGGARVAVVVPTEGLAALLQRMLKRLGVDVTVQTYDVFAGRQARRSFRRLPPESELTPPAVARLKRCAELLPAIARLATRPAGRIDDDADAPPVRERAWRGDLQHLFGDRSLIEEVAGKAGLAAHVVEAVLERSNVQFSATAERAWAHVTDRERLVAVDGRRLDAGTSTEVATTIDVEDYAVLFDLERRRAELAGEPPRALRTYDVVAIDEAQELSLLELALLGRSVAPGGSLVVAGDADQHTDETGAFVGWDDAMRALGAEEHERLTLEVGYRCPPAVVDAARAVRDGGKASLDVLRFATERELAAALGAEMSRILARDRDGAIGVVCRRATTARRIADLLREHVPVRLVFDGHFLPRGPVQVTVVTDIKGLELDWIIVPDATAAEWTDEPASRRALYVAITRARHQVVMAAVGEPSPLLVTSAC